jgi:DNA polymerase
MHCHDEAVIEAPMEAGLQEVIDIMCVAPPWAEGLPLRADGYECAFYQKG